MADLLVHPANMQLVRVDRIEDELVAMATRHATLIALHAVPFPGTGTIVWLAATRRRARGTRRARVAYLLTLARHGVLLGKIADRLRRPGVPGPPDPAPAPAAVRMHEVLAP
jgi:hypothetical protein